MQNDRAALEHSIAHDLVSLVSYSEGSVVSRTVAKNKAGTLTLFAFDKGEGLSEHSAPFNAFVQILDGEVEITIGGKPVRAAAGQIVVMPANIPHSLTAITPFKMMLVMLRDA